MMDIPLLPGGQHGSLAEVVSSLLAGLGVAGFTNELELDPAQSVCLLLVDGLGWRALREYSADAPFLTSLAAGSAPITCGFPSTTAASVATICTGVSTGLPAIVGFSFAIPNGISVHALAIDI